jgi:hypothetical protein
MKTKMRFAAPVASAATAIMLLAGCSNDGPTTLAQGEDVEFVGDVGLAGETLNATAEEEDGKVAGEFQITDVVVTVECADTDTDGVVVLGGEIARDPDLTDNDQPDGEFDPGALLALIIREGDPDRVALLSNADYNAGTCTELLESIPKEGPTVDHNSADVEDGYDIETG